MSKVHLSIPITWTAKYTSFIEVEVPPLFATSREAARDYVKKAIKSKIVDVICVAIEQQIDKDKNKEREETFIDIKIDPDEENWWGPWQPNKAQTPYNK